VRTFVVRHGRTAWNAAGRLQGGTDISLDDVGVAQAHGAAQALGGIVAADVTIVSSPLVRAADTASALNSLLGTGVHLDERLRERSYGPWEGLSSDERRHGWPDAVERWKVTGDPGVEGIESQTEVIERMGLAINEWRDRASGDLVVFTHGGAARASVQSLIGLPPERRVMGLLGNGAWVRMHRRADRVWVLDQFNVTPASTPT
jgi:probable phosphoglycerate mutase